MPAESKKKVQIPASLPGDLSMIIDKKKQDLIRVTNSSLITLFWEIGRTVNSYLEKDTRRLDFFKFQDVAHLLNLSGCTWFDKKNLQKMMEFAFQFDSSEIVTLVSPFLTWEHIKLLLSCHDSDTKAYYIQQVIQNGLSVSNLRKLINSGKSQSSISRTERLMLNPVTGRKNLNKLYQTAIRDAVAKNITINNFFREPFLADFSRLLDYTGGDVKLLGMQKPDVNLKLLKSLFLHLEKYSSRHNKWLNCFLNLSLREIGERINQDINHEIGKLDQESIFKNLSAILAIEFGKNIKPAQLYESSVFARQFENSNLAIRIGYMVSWEHIVVLLPIEEMEAKFFYARLAATNNLSVATLKSKIAQNIFANTNGARESEKNIIRELTRSIKPQNEKSNQMPNKVVISFADLDQDFSLRNVLKNPYFSIFT